MIDKKPTENIPNIKKSGGKVLEGAEELIVEWSYALNELAFASRGGLNTFREIEETAADHWLKKIAGKLPKTKTAYEAAMKFRDIADERKVILKDNFKLEEKEGTVLGTFLSHDCPYKNCCILRKKEGKKFICFRATPFITAISSMTDKEHRSEILYEQTNPGKVCIIKGIPTQTAFKVGLSYRLSKGTVKINDIDLEKIGIGLIDNVTITPSRKELSEKKLTAMSYSQTKYPAGMIIMNIQDAKSLGLEEKDTVFVTKAGEKEEAKLIETESYEAEKGEYEIPGLEVEKMEEEKEVKGKEEEIGGEEKAVKSEEKPEEGKETREENIEKGGEVSKEPIEEGTGEEKAEPLKEVKEESVEKKPKEIKKEKPVIKEKSMKKPEKIPKPKDISKKPQSKQKPTKSKEEKKISKPAEQKPKPAKKEKSEDKNKQKKDFESQIEALRNT